MMSRKMLPALAALAVVGLSATSAFALPFSYSVATTFNGNTQSAGVNNVIALGGTNTLTVVGATEPTNTVPTDIVLANFNIDTASDDPTEFVIPFTLTVSITNDGDTDTFDVGGTLTLSNLTSASALQTPSFNALPGAKSIGGLIFELSMPTFTPDTVNNVRVGAFGVRVNAVPEPASLAMAGLGVLAAAGLGIRRRLRKA